MELLNKNIVLTGASGGIGQALAKRLALAGARLWLVGRNQPELNRLRLCMEHPERHTVFVVENYSDEEILSLSRCFHAGHRLDVLINNAGTSRFALLEQQSIADVREQLLVNVEIPLILTRALIHQFSAEGTILNVGSILGELGHPGYSVYCASKAALHRFSEALGRELSTTGIKVLYAAPRATQTGLNSAAVNAMNKALGNKSDSPEAVAQFITEALLQDRRRARMGGVERVFVRINALLPHLVDRALIKKLPLIKRFLQSDAPVEMK
ncbi:MULTISPECIES: SDR family oxidoreductase [Pantoea]|uniref:SDR family oxidoreductase n=1 Tax=Pantoea TaxID=53335 RepID=UPI000A219287|nr:MULTISPECIES: SDR family oxidoreductase [Pantoea]KAA6044440.1 SDR family oxidoreductase [Pantoea sp. Bo_7]KAA6090217.1 SDR family oxidoreductase [Pantoea sp. Bo_10]ORM79994.1 short chain dehydrogenase [Pantoea eucrina]RBO13625.1 short chain dehydrogenase [Pantoea sp. 3_1284]